MLRRRWVDNIKLDLREIGWDAMDWIDVAQDRDQCRAFEWLLNCQLLKKGSAPLVRLNTIVKVWWEKLN
jgi:hypothetical protein